MNMKDHVAWATVRPSLADAFTRPKLFESRFATCRENTGATPMKRTFCGCAENSSALCTKYKPPRMEQIVGIMIKIDERRQVADVSRERYFTECVSNEWHASRKDCFDMFINASFGNHVFLISSHDCISGLLVVTQSACNLSSMLVARLSAIGRAACLLLCRLTRRHGARLCEPLPSICKQGSPPTLKANEMLIANSLGVVPGRGDVLQEFHSMVGAVCNVGFCW